MEEIIKQSNLPTEEKNFVRFDRNLAHNALDFNKQFGSDGPLIFDVMLYIALTYEKNLFSYGKLDPHDFADKMGYKLPNLLSTSNHSKQLTNDKEKRMLFERLKKKSPEKLKVNGSEKESFFYTVLDNALYRALSENLVFSNQFRVDDETISELASIRLINRVSKVYTDENKLATRRNKLYYTYTVDKEFENNLTKFFLQIDLYSSKKLRKSNSVYLYCYLKNLQLSLHKQNKSETSTLNFDMLVSLAQIVCSNPSDAKKKLRQKVLHIFKITDLKGEFQFIQRETGKFAYQPVIKFYNNMPQLHSKEYFEQIQSAVHARFKHEVRKVFAIAGGTKKTGLKSAYDWIKASMNEGSANTNYKEIINCYKDCHLHVCGTNKEKVLRSLETSAIIGINSLISSIDGAKK